MLASLVGIDYFDFHLAHVTGAEDADARRIFTRHGPRHAPNLEILAFDAHTVGQDDLDLAHDRRHLDLRGAPEEARASEIEANLAEQHTNPEMSG